MKTSRLILISIAAFSLAACNNDMDNLTDGQVAAKISADIENVQTRADGGSWEANDQIGISCTSAGKTNYTNVLYTIDNTATGSFSSTTPIYFQDLQEVTFSAYYPYEAAGGTIPKTIAAADQTTDAQKDIDYMYASGAKASKTNPEVKFIDNGAGQDCRFQHRMVRLNLTFNKGKDTDLTKMTDFTVKGLKMEGTFNTTDGAATATATAAAADLTITETPVSSDTYSRSLILFPQDVTDGKFNLELTLDGQTYKAELSIPSSGTALKSGFKYNYSIDVNKTGISVNQSNIADWSNGGSGSGDAVMQ